jgi:hypothetical protein
MPEKISLVDAALKIHRSYNATTRLVFTGVLVGGKDENGAWYVLRDSIDRYLQREQVSRSAQATA